MKTFKKSVAAFLVVLMLLTSAPLAGFVGLELPDFFSSEAKAAGVPGYSAGAAVQWALDHYEDIDSKLTGKGYWSEGGDCANFVSQCVYMGGIDMKNEWYSNGYWRVWDPFTWIRAHELYEYMVELGGVSINNPRASDLSVGDLIFYKTRSDGKMHHSAIVVEINNGVPVICAHSVLNNYGVYEKYKDPNWTLGYSGSRIYAVKMYGDMCYAENPRNFTVYTAKSGARKNLYASPSASSAVIGSTMAESHTYIHVYEERTVNGIKWGKMQWAGNWAWTKLSGFNRKNDIASYRPSHDFGAWKTIAVANCVNDGITERVCKRCGHTERKTTPKLGHTPGAEATCLTAQICTVCDTVLVDALGHNFEGGLKMPTCTESVTGSYTCTRCGFSYDVNEKWTEYTVPLQEYNGHYYQIFNDAITWQEAKELCEGLRGHLIVINDEAEQNFMTELVADASKDNLWIGLYSDDDTLSWKWVNGEDVSYTKWGETEPTADITELYVHTYARDYGTYKVAGDWNNMQNNGIGSAGGDYYTPSNYGFICEWDSYEDYPDIWKDETSASIKSVTGYTYKEKETITSYETSVDGYIQDGGEWIQQSSGKINYVSSWPSGFNTSHSLYSSYNKTPVTASETETTKTAVTTTNKGYIFWHWCRGGSEGNINRLINDSKTSEFDTFHAFESTSVPGSYTSSANAYDLGKGVSRGGCNDTYWWISAGARTSSLITIKTCSWTSYNKLFNYYKWSPNLGYTAKENLPEAVVSMIDNGTANSDYQLGDSKTVYSYRLDALGHQMGEWYTVTVATCLENGFVRRDCQRCDYYETEETTAPCIEVKDDAVSPTCIDTGLTEGSHCGVCGKTIVEQQIIPTTEHPFGEWKEVYPISCGKDGLEERICSYCGFTDQRAIINPDPDHLGPVTKETIAPGCEHLHAQGWTEYHCEKCDERWTDDFTDPLTAVWGEWMVTIEPDCSLNHSKEPTENGERERICQLCGAVDRETLLAEHVLEAYEISSTCISGGETGEKCKICNQIWMDTVDPLGHLLYDDWYTVYEAKCEEPGQERRDCHRDGCEYHETRIIDPINHDYKEIYTVDATCDKQGYTHYVCNNDNSHEYKDYNKPELGHVADNNWIVTKEPTCAEKGEELCKCIRYDDGDTCNKVYTREIEIDPDAHDWDNGVINPESTCKLHGTKTFTCQNDNSHKKTESVALNPNNHIGETYIKDAKTETCTEDGYTGDKYCSDCDALLEKGEAIDKLGHDMGKWSDNNNGTHTRECQRDNGCTYTETENCKFGDWVVTKEATCTAKGSKERACTVCGYKETATIEIKAHTPDEAIIENRIAPKCEEKGSYDEVVYCTECSKELSREQKEIPAISHDWDNGVINPDSTCKVHGIKTYTCQNDNSHKKTESVELNPDNHVGETYIKDAKTETCTEDGYTGDKYCSDCDALLEKGEIVPTHGHDYHKIDNKCKAPDYGVAGYDYYECSYDASHNYKTEIAPLIKTTFTATFITTAPFFGEDKVVGIVTFEQGDSFVDEPKVESYDNYTFAWDEYELRDEDITIYGRYTEIEIDDVTDLEPDKEAKDLGNGIVNITLEAKATSKKIKVVTANPVDVILVLDQSGSMAETLSSDGTTKRDALVRCANDFVNELYNNAFETGLDHRVALVGFSYSDYNNGNFKNTEILATADGRSVNYKNLNDSVYSSALMPVVSTNGTINSNIVNGINSVVAEGATAAHLGLEMAKNIFSVNDKEIDRERIVLFITDGTPTSWGEQTDLVKEVAAAAITEANSLKNEQEAIIYSIGVHANSDPTVEFTQDIYGVKTDNRGNFQSYDFNRFLHAVSSNYPDAGSIKVSEMGEGNKNAGYYFAVNDTSKLSDIFTKILYGKVYKVVTFDKVTLFDTVSKEFTLTLEQETEMREILINEQGMKNEDVTVTRNADGTTSLRFENVRAQKVYNADGSSYYCAKVSFNVSANENSLDKSGETDTNTEDAGIEYDGTAVEEYEVPTVNLQANRKIVVFTINGVVYRIDEAKLGDEIVAPESELAKWNIPEGTIVEDECAIFEADVIDSTEYVVLWNSEGITKTETYSYGSVIKAPEAAEKQGYDFLKWSPSVPATMPNYNMTFTAVYTPKHTHNYSAVKNYGKCTEGITTVYECACGDTYEETAEAKAHSMKALVEQTNSGTLIEKVICDICGASNSQELTYKVTYKEGKRSQVLDLTLLENDISVQPDGTIEIRFYLGEDIDKNYVVKRIDENGRSYNYTPRKENGYLIFAADHFSFYVVTEIDEASGKPAEDLSYGEVYCISNGHSYTSKVTAPTCTANGYTTHTCTSCGDTYTDAETTAMGHKMSAFVVTKQPTCTDKGTETATCSNCTHTETRSVAAKGHNYKNNICTNCGKSKVENCNHLCHKKGFMGFIWKIVRFFWKLFKVNPVCDCGVKHY